VKKAATAEFAAQGAPAGGGGDGGGGGGEGAGGGAAAKKMGMKKGFQPRKK
jgi:hypothetical protein